MDYSQPSDEVHHLCTKLTNAMAPRSTTNSIKRTNISFLFDESASVTEKNYRTVLSCGRRMIETYDFGSQDEKAPLAVSLYRFNSKVTLELGLSSKKQEIFNKLDSMPYDSGSTSTGQALTRVYNDLKAANRPEYSNVIVLMTDGDLNGAEQILKTIENTKDMLIKIVVVFMAMPVPQNLYTTTPLKEWQVVAFRDYSIMDQVFRYYSSFSDHTKPDIVESHPTPARVAVYFGAPAIFHLKIEKYIVEVYKDMEQTPKQILECRFPEMMIEDLEPQTKYRIRVCVQFNNGARSAFSEFHPITTLSLHSIQESMSNPEKLRAAHSKLLKGLPNAKVPQRLQEYGFQKVNVLVIGPMGHGKSSLINTICSVFAESYITPARTNCDPHETVTNQYERVNAFGGFNSSSTGYINVYDTFGIRHYKKGENPPVNKTFENSNFAECLSKILSGEIRPGYKEWDKIDFKKLARDADNINNKIHAIAFVVDINAVTNDSELEVINSFMKKIVTDLHYEPLVIFTKCDMILEKNLPEGIRCNLRDVWQNDELRKYIDYFCKRVPNIQPKDILLFSNYTTKYTDEEKDYERELLLLNIVETLKQKAEACVQRSYNRHIKVMDQDNKFIGLVKFEEETDSLFKVVPDLQELIATYYENNISCTNFHFVRSYRVGDKERQERLDSKKTQDVKEKQISNWYLEQDGGLCMRIYVGTPPNSASNPAPSVISQSSRTSQPTQIDSNIQQIQELVVLIDGEAVGEMRNIPDTMSIADLKALFKHEYPEHTNLNLSLDESQLSARNVIKKDSDTLVLNLVTTSNAGTSTTPQQNTNLKLRLRISAENRVIDQDLNLPSQSVTLEELSRIIDSDQFKATARIGNFAFLKKGKFKVPITQGNWNKTLVGDVLEEVSGAYLIDIKLT